MGTLAKIVCLGFGAFYVLGLVLFLLAPTMRKLLRRRLSNQVRDPAKRCERRGASGNAHDEMDDR